MRLPIGLKTQNYAALAWQNPWLLTGNEKVRNYLRYRWTRHAVLMDARRAGPVFMTYSISRRCNLRCRFCIVGDVLHKPGYRTHEATVAQTARVLAHPVARRCLYVMLTGGEPLLNPEVVPIARRIKGRRHILSINTNGLLLPDLLDDLVAARVDFLNVSHYDENADALASVLPDARRRLYCKIVKVIGQPHVERPALLDEAIRLARESGCRRIFFQNTYPHVDGLVSRSALPSSLAPTGAEQPPITDETGGYDAVKAELTARYPDVRIYWPTPVQVRSAPRKRTCRMPWYLFAVDAHGKLALCSAHASCTETSIFDLAPDQVMNAEPWLSTRRGLLDASAPTPDRCEGCYTLTDPWRADM